MIPIYNEETFCMVPFRELHINPNKQFRNCCIQKNVLGEIDLKVNDPNHWFSTDESLQNIRNSLITGEKHSSCANCWSIEDKNLRSHRQNWTSRYQKNNDLNLDPKIEVIDLRLGNRCNLKCRMCNSSWSNLISDQVKVLKAQGYKNSFTQMPVLGTIKQDEKFLQDLLDFIKKTSSIKVIHFAGGEPFVMDEVEEFLFKMIDENMTDVEISLLTNTTVIKDKMIKCLEKFKSVHISCSIDGIGKYLEYQRFPSKWNVIERNFIKLYNSKLNVYISPCWSNLNVLGMSDFLIWSNNFPKSHVSYNEVTQPSYLDWRLVPLEYRTEQLQKLVNLSLHSKIHDNYKKFIEKFKTEVKEFNEDESVRYQDAVICWDSYSQIKYHELYSWNHILK